MIRPCASRRVATALALTFAAANASAFTPSINYVDAAGTGFKDTTPVSPVGGNSGTTLGAQRKQAFEFAVNVWAQRLQSNVVVSINAQWTQQFCSQSSATLGSAGPALVASGSLPKSNVFYPRALADALTGTDTNAGSADINAEFNKDVDAKSVPCLGSVVFYYGLDQNSGGNVNFIDVAIHEMGHGLGFVSGLDANTGASEFGSGLFTILDYSLFDENTALPLVATSPATSDNQSQRAAVAISNGALTWNATRTNTGNSFLSAGKNNGHVRMFAPNPPQGGSSISHWDTVASPNLVMEPSYTGDAGAHVDLTTCAFLDIGWTLLAGFACPDLPTSADLSLTNSGSPDPAIAGSNLTYTIALHNNGPSAAQSVLISIPLPATLNFMSVTKPAGWTSTTPAVGANGTVKLTNPSIASGATANFTLVVRVKGDTAQGVSISTTATASSGSSDPNLANNAPTASNTVNTQSDLSITNADSPDPVIAGANVTYSIQLTNNGPSFASSVAVSDPLPSATRFVSASAPAGWTITAPSVGTNGTVSFTRSSFDRTAPASFTVVAKVIDTASNNSVLSNTASVTASTTDPTPSNNSKTATTVVNRRADLAVTNSGSPDPVHAGSNLTYSAKVTNNGPSTSFSVGLSTDLPANTTFVSLTSGMSCTTPAVGGTGTVNCTVPSRAPGVSAKYTLVVKVDSATANGTVISDTVTASATTIDPSAGNNSAVSNVTVQNP